MLCNSFEIWRQIHNFSNQPKSLIKAYNLWQWVIDIFTKLSKIGLSMECFAADFLRIFTKKRRNLAFRRTAGYSLSNPNISGILLKFPNFHMVVSALQSTSILSYVFGVCNLTNFYNKVCIKKKNASCNRNHKLLNWVISIPN